MGILSKAWKGLKKTVKKVARGAKKLAKKIAYADPTGLGKKAWDFSSKVGKKVMKGVGKVVNALGPVGMIALSIIAPYAAPLWSAFGAAAAASTSIWGTIGQAIYTAGNWVGGTLGAMTQGISKGISQLASGSFSKAGSSVVQGFAKAFSGEAGKAGVKAGVEAATKSAIQSAAGKSVMDQVTGEIAKDMGMGTTAPTVPTDEVGNQMLSKGPEPFSVDKAAGLDNYAPAPASDALTPSVGERLNTATSLGPISNTQAKAAITNTPQSGSLLSKAGKVAKSLLAGGQQQSIQSVAPVGDPGGNRFGGDAFARGGIGSAGGQFLTEQQRQALQLSEQQLTRGFG